MILVVDDQADTRRAVARLLRFAGYEVIDVDSGDAAIRALAAQQVSLVILDFHMPGRNGLWLLEQMKNDSRFDRIPTIMFTADDGDVQERALALGVSAFVVKGSLDWAVLHRQVIRLIGEGRAEPMRTPVAKPRAKEVG